uniref:Reverse transcriptase zinc-binding domain-containing protein n=1 Tax=Ananas comosus var. bracteatus TaxID=296719 RepID=A0A6V7NWW3_ANACO|nr:unnamed protein product [Ananas comosus var. bracteatus]
MVARALREGSSFRPHSQWWRSVLGIRDIFKCGVTHSIRDGQSANFWTNLWCGEAPLYSLYSHIFRDTAHKSCRASDCFDGNGWKWEVILADFTPKTAFDRELTQELKEMLSNLTLNTRMDVVK